MTISLTDRTRYALAYITMLACLAGYYRFTWLGLPEKTTAGRYDTLTLLFIIAALFSLALCIRQRLWRAPFVVAWCLCVLLVPLNWWNYAFYQDTLVFSSLRYGFDAAQGTQALTSLGHVAEAITGGLLLATTLGLAILWSPSPPRAYGLHGTLLVLMASLAVQHDLRHNSTQTGMHVVDSHPVMSFVRSAYVPAPVITAEHVAAITALREDLQPAEWRSRYPLYQVPVSSTPQPLRPENVIILVLESMRASETGYYAGTDLTPNLDRIARQATVVTDFYANSTQTVRGEMSILCGVLDYARGAPFSSYQLPVLNHCLPEILRRHGYATHWFHGFDRTFFKRNTFLPHVGFRHIHDQPVIRDAWPAVNHLGWGVADHDLVRYALDVLSKEEQPFFAEILTVSNHFPFHWEWNDIHWPHAGQTAADASLMDNYRMGVRYTDFALGQFWDAFQESPLARNTALIIVADHGIWAFDEQSPEASHVRHEQLFRIPFLAVLPSREPERLERIGSQVDIAPSLLAYLGLHTPTAFLGVDILSEEDVRARPSAVMVKGGSFGLRLGNLHCFPENGVCPDGTEEDACGNAYQPGAVQCVASGSDLLTLQSPGDLRDADVDTAFVTEVIEYMSLAHVLGFMPKAEKDAGSAPLVTTRSTH